MGETPERREAEPKKRIVAIQIGDWADAECDFLEVSPDLDLTKEKLAYDKWRNEMDRALRSGQGAFDSKTFAQWLKERGAKDSADVERFVGDGVD